jgi:hypothetical protein
MTNLNTYTYLLMILFMYIGAASGSTAGGIKGATAQNPRVAVSFHEADRSFEGAGMDPGVGIEKQQPAAGGGLVHQAPEPASVLEGQDSQGHGAEEAQGAVHSMQMNDYGA